MNRREMALFAVHQTRIGSTRPGRPFATRQRPRVRATRAAPVSERSVEELEVDEAFGDDELEEDEATERDGGGLR